MEGLLTPAKAKEYKDFFDTNGYLVVPGFASVAECDGMMARMGSLLDAWDPSQHLEVSDTCNSVYVHHGCLSVFLCLSLCL
jgi:phytanoyl-CoA hydroxylase